MLNDETIEGFGFGQQESAYIREGFGTNGTSAQYEAMETAETETVETEAVD